MNYFVSVDELLKTNTGIPNEVSDSFVADNLIALRYILCVLRMLIGCPLIINSGFRTEEVNKAVNGSECSYHLIGRAADITCSNMESLREVCREWHQKGIFIEYVDYPHSNFIHVAI